MISHEVYPHVRAAVALLVQEQNGAPFTAPTLEEHIHSQLWAYVTHAVKEVGPSSAGVIPARRDGREKTWQYMIRFWYNAPNGAELIAESEEPELMQGTGSLPDIIATYGAELHAEQITDGVPSELSLEAVKAKLPQFRNNLGRQGSAVLRIPYTIGDESYLCQVDVARPGA